MAQCLLPRDLGNTAASEAPDLATACTVFPVPTEDGHAMHVGEAQHCGLLWERTPAPPPGWSLSLPSSGTRYTPVSVLAAAGCELMHALSVAVLPNAVLAG